MTCRCFLKDNKDIESISFLQCMKVNDPAEKGHIAREYTMPRKEASRPEVTKWKCGNNISREGITTMGKWQQTDVPVYSAGCVGKNDYESFKLKVNISKTG